MNRTLTVTVKSDEEFAADVEEGIRKLKAGEPVNPGHTVSFLTQEHLMETFSPTRLALIRTVAEDEPESIRETARMVDRDVKNVHEDLSLLDQLGVIWFGEEGQAKRPVFPFDELVISVEFDRDGDPVEDVDAAMPP